MTDNIDRLIEKIRAPSRAPSGHLITHEGARRLIEDFMRENAAWPPSRPINTAPQPKRTHVTGDARYFLAFVPELVGGDPNAGFTVCWWEPNVNGGCWCSSDGEDIEPTIWWPLPHLGEMK